MENEDKMWIKFQSKFAARLTQPEEKMANIQVDVSNDEESSDGLDANITHLCQESKWLLWSQWKSRGGEMLIEFFNVDMKMQFIKYWTKCWFDF